jgi:hypothetical protein
LLCAQEAEPEGTGEIGADQPEAVRILLLKTKRRSSIASE